MANRSGMTTTAPPAPTKALTARYTSHGYQCRSADILIIVTRALGGRSVRTPEKIVSTAIPASRNSPGTLYRKRPQKGGRRRAATNGPNHRPSNGAVTRIGKVAVAPLKR